MTATMGTRGRIKQRIGGVLAGCIILAAISGAFFPFLWMLRTALTPAGDIFSDHGGLLPDHLTLVNFARVIGITSSEQAVVAGGSGARMNFLRYLGNSVVYCGLIASIQTASCSMAAYALSRLRFPGRRLIFGGIVATLMIPPIFTTLPIFSLVRELGWLNTFHGLVAPTLLMSPLTVFFLRQFFLAMPNEVEEAALLDGAGRWAIFWRVVIPMNRGPLTTITIVTTVWAWKDYLWPLLAGRAENTRLLTVALGVFQQQSPNLQPDWTGLMAASVLSVVPVFLLLGFFGRRLVESLAFTGGK